MININPVAFKISCSCILLLVIVNFGLSQTPLLQNVYNHHVTSLDGKWQTIIDPYENGFYNYRYEPLEYQSNPGNGAFFTNAKAKSKTDLVEYDFDKSETLDVPGDWNTQKDQLFYYEGSLWYKKSFDYDLKKADNKLFIYFEASNYQTDVYFNGKKLGRHIGGFTPFNYELTDLLSPTDNFIIVKVDNKRKKEGVPTLNTDWWNYGGLTRNVKLVEVPKTYIADYSIQLDPDNDKKINCAISINGEAAASQPVTIEIPELRIKETLTPNAEGQVTTTIKANRVNYWSVDSPKLYTVNISIADETLTDQIGFRTIETKGADILLNGKSIFLKGISIHEENPIRGGRAHSKADARQLLEWAKELGCNYVRLAHYPHNEHMVRLADEMGMLVWEENPVYWTIDWKNADTYANAENQLTEVINRDKNRASVIIWSMANETPRSDARNIFLNKLAAHTRALDPTRLISAALEQKDYNGQKEVRTIDDAFADVVDILSFNQYIGWYDGLVDKTSRISWVITQGKPVIISEFGAGAKYGYHADQDTRWTEEYQAHLYTETLNMLGKIDQLRGVSPWILVDFRSPRRMLPEIQDGWNRKGLISEKGEKKEAFYVLRDWYNQR